MKLLILGGTRFLGRYLAQSAIERGHEVTLFNRGQENTTLFPNIENLIGDRDGNLEALKGRTWDAVIDTCGFVPRVVKESAQLLSDSVEQYVFISSKSVYTDLSKIGIDEDHPVATLTEEKVEEITKGTAGPIYNQYYGALKYLCEQAIEEVMPKRTLSIRAGLIVGPHDDSDRFSYWVQRVAYGGEIMAPGSPNKQIQFIDVRDLSEWIISIVENRKNGVYNASGPDYTLTMQDFLEQCKLATQSNATFTWVSEPFLEDNQVGYWIELPLWIPDHLNQAGFLAASSQKALNDGLTIRPLTTTLRDTLAWELSRPLDTVRKAGLNLYKEADLLSRWHQQTS